ncbi:MAG: DNA gyrase inhibitor YacG [Candidatus Erwinia impunctatus]|nr:DNA gyrase inhibitor YacG [Culicoides impunctatus]
MQCETLSVSCPGCGKSVLWIEESSWRPFCSKRCQLIDLGEWAAEEKCIPGSELSEHDAWSDSDLSR